VIPGAVSPTWPRSDVDSRPFWTLSAEQALKQVDSQEGGLRSAEAAARLKGLEAGAIVWILVEGESKPFKILLEKKK